MIDAEGIGRVLRTVAGRWEEMAGDPGGRAMRALPGSFWMNAAGGRAGGGRWVTMLMYTESEADADAMRAVLQRWQARGSGAAGGPGGQGAGGPDLIQIGRKRD